MLALTWMQSLTAFVFVMVCVLLILLVLIQKGRGGGLSGAFGGVGSYSPFGTKTGDALTWATVVLTALYLLVAVMANYAFRPTSLESLNPGLSAPAGEVPAGDAAANAAADAAMDAAQGSGAADGAPAAPEAPATTQP